MFQTQFYGALHSDLSIRPQSVVSRNLRSDFPHLDSTFYKIWYLYLVLNGTRILTQDLGMDMKPTLNIIVLVERPLYLPS